MYWNLGRHLKYEETDHFLDGYSAGLQIALYCSNSQCHESSSSDKPDLALYRMNEAMRLATVKCVSLPFWSACSFPSFCPGVHYPYYTESATAFRRRIRRKPNDACEWPLGLGFIQNG